ncbi:MAG TPA: PEGA domain-containing protein [Gemmatimonadales bacterium]|nr:PEGA domain-containing protein [Gemmatimonadales bacterium]
MRPRLAVVAAPFVLVACATIMHGSSQSVSIASQPTGASVMIDNQPAGVTPVAAKLKRKDMHHIAIKMDGYQPFEMVTTRKVSGWVWGNIIFGGLIGLAVDAMTGGLYEVRPEEVNGQLVKSGAVLSRHDGNVYVFLVPQADPSWRKIGQLQHQQ